MAARNLHNWQQQVNISNNVMCPINVLYVLKTRLKTIHKHNLVSLSVTQFTCPDTIYLSMTL